ncbi:MULTISPECIES: DUF4382 domain-containing protein [Halobacterium]|uniref:DUF4382 domain-containing protein n=1 Tax=Halobacterium TaxID=2239 RepID=UPI00073E3436|nr:MULTISPECIES: DUF4382 domain-containing protein [Halobacterium]MCG1004388.1 DUF4382 domain-containing protein [Halobacterium noricense]
MRRTAASLLVAALVMVAGCAGGIAGPNGAQTTDNGGDGTVSFYVSDEQNAIGQFEHLNVTVTSVGFAQSADADANASGNWTIETDSEGGLEVGLVGNLTAGENATVTVTHDGEVVENATVEVDDADVSVTTDANGTVTVAVPADADEFALTASTDGDSAYGETEASLEAEYEADDDDDENETEWVERDVDSRVVDLTELQGANATLLGNVSVPAGEYETVFVHVGEVEGTLETGEQVNVKLPSQKLHLNKDVTVTESGSVEFVFDITVFEAGNSGKYILKPVASESGTDVPIERVDVETDGEAELEANFVGNVTAGENATVRVTQDGEPVESATVTVSEDVTVTTDANGTATVSVPENVEELEVDVETAEDSAYGEAEAELEVEFGDSDDSDSDADSELELGAVLEGSLAPGENATVVVTDGDGEAVEDATVAVDGEVVGETNADGELSFAVPADVSLDTEVTVTADGETITLDSTTAAAAN